MAKGDPYRTLGVSPDASDDELRDAYRRLVKLHHPDRNGGTPEATRRFQEIQDAYDRVEELRKEAPRGARQAPPPRGRQAPPRARGARPRPADDADVAARMADLERELREAQAAQEKARRAARDAVADATGRPTDEELGYVTTDDSFSKILADARAELADRVADARQHPAARRVADLIDGIDELASRFKPRPPRT
jgi:curved DNA-binding protein CbpA